MIGFSTSVRASMCAALASFLCVLAVPSGGNAAVSAPVTITSPADRWSYADVADLFVEAPVVAKLRIAEAIAIKDAASPAGRPGTIRYYLVGDVVALIRGMGGVAPRVGWIADVPLDARGKAPKLKKMQVVLAAMAVPGKPGELRLAARDAMVGWSPAFEARVRKVVGEGLAANAPPHVSGIASAFHSAGNLPGEGESQIFLTTREQMSVSLGVLRRPGQAPSWSVALGEIVDEAATVPAKDTLGWYRLACVLPRELPASAIGDLAEADAAAARADYAFVIEAMGPCMRTRG